MLIVNTKQVTPTMVLLGTDDFKKLVTAASKSEAIDVHSEEDDVPTELIMKLADDGGAFDFWNDPEEDIYTLDDLKVRYR